MQSPKVILSVLDGWGLSPLSRGNAVAQANTPNFDYLWSKSPRTFLSAHGMDVGLPDGAMGGSEVGHLNIGAGRTVMQDLAFINNEIATGAFFENQVLSQAMQAAQSRGGRIHLIGLLSDGGVHSHIGHIKALAKLSEKLQTAPLQLHALLDGRDVLPRSAETYFAQVAAMPNIEIATVGGRFHAMDRDQNWDRVKKGYDCIFHNAAPKADSPLAGLNASYANDVSDEHVLPYRLTDADRNINDGDLVITFNFRGDRMRQLTRAIIDAEFDSFDRGNVPNVEFIGFTNYGDLPPYTALFEKADVSGSLGEHISNLGFTQLRAAETEKYNHVTFFFNGAVADPFENEERLLVPSPKVAGYDEQPEMSAGALTEQFVAQLGTLDPKFALINFANPDMVGHTGDVEATKRACEFVDSCIGKIAEFARANGYYYIVTADHGNADQMIDLSTMYTDDEKSWTAHSLAPVPFMIAAPTVATRDIILASKGTLGNIAPTVLDLMQIEKPAPMTGTSLIAKGI